MTDEEIRALVDEFRQRADADPEIRSVMRKIRNQDADFSDTSRMFWRRSELLRDYLQGVVLDLPAGAREQLCTELLNAGYNETNEVMQSVQQALDEPQGIHLNPVLPKRPAERIHTVAHALEDPTVPDDKIVRRAGAPVANVQMSFHDRYIEENARIRAKLGMKPTITRYGSGCCKWCSEVAGRYRFGEQPKDIFRRHDNCNCTIIYDNQVLRGRETSSGRSKTWEEVKPEDVLAEGFSPKVFSRSEAAALQERLMQGLTLAGKRDIIKNIELPPETNQIRSMSAETKQLISDALDKIMGMYEVHLDQLITEPIYTEDGKAIAITVPFQFQPRHGKDGELVKCLVINSMYDFMGSQDEMQKRIMRNFDNKALASNSIEGLIAHELAHIMTFQNNRTYSGLLLTNKQLTEKFDILSEMCNLSEISLYAAMKFDVSEVIAEAFVKVLRGEAIPEPVMPYLNEYIERWRK